MKSFESDSSLKETLESILDTFITFDPRLNWSNETESIFTKEEIQQKYLVTFMSPRYTRTAYLTIKFEEAKTTPHMLIQLCAESSMTHNEGLVRTAYHGAWSASTTPLLWQQIGTTLATWYAEQIHALR